ncbi:putative nucleic acid-binding Zn ribbon protein [Nocardioides ginsengisegetis]|uniref:Putative nucleic acid-binding Zn ribbon protein n=1 Tax=Nocardioides ginsengisegetis TaxID=661491 RepID=A0A7W3PBB2_9ACTN|nr:putative nucleic acid-binding Zn ribbon protein [Nocardioides ginsengisegetis]
MDAEPEEPEGETFDEPEAPTVGEPEPAPHQDDGLDLARAMARGAARSTPPAKGKKKRRDLRTPRGRVSGAHPDERDPQLLDATLGRLVADHGWGLDLRVHGVFGRWAELVGDEVAAHCTPESFADGKLVVRTDSTAWATQLKLLAPTVVRRLNEELGHGTVALIEVLGPHLPTWKKGLRSARDGRGPRDTYG